MPTRRRKPTPVDLSRVRRYSIARRPNKVTVTAFAKPVDPADDAAAFFRSLPDFLKAADLKEFIRLAVRARRRNKPFHLLLGAHTIKVGLSPLFIDLMQHGIVTGLSFNGAGLVHDLELAFFGGTSEDVQAGLQDGTFGMVRETAELFGRVTALARDETLGLGQACGEFILRRKAPRRKHSVFAVARQLDLPVTVHVGIGTDIVCQHPEFDGAAVGEASQRDFRILADICARLDRGGVVANIGSAVILPEVFLKALTVARNLQRGKSSLTTANFDMFDLYRPRVNIVTRPTFRAGRGFSFIGHHELMVPLLAWGLKLAWKSGRLR